MTSIPGIGAQTAAVILAEMGCVANYHSGRQLAAHAGLTPQEYASGCSLKGKPRLSHLGNARLRKALYMPAVVAMTHASGTGLFQPTIIEPGKGENAGGWSNNA